ncbi:Uncharacterized protein TCM_016911 [Theobroma cacao]|uniref:Reverse transcriptase Ty1/copia-type domain-containing protein n=1 Tax=Theobroma cacao TaxID=3641 RepID=A0A061EDE9_THECC|nr:Uncharacterized protein TCM_016911 [Theobroma cacao]
MSAELKALQDSGTWSIVQRPPNSHVIGCKWVYKVKLNVDGQIERYKARLVAKGYNQIAGFDYKEIFSPVAKQTTSNADHSLFTMKTNNGEFIALLLLEIARSPEGISISQRKYTLDLLEEHGLLGAKPVSIPIDYNQKLVKAQDEEKLINPTDYKQLVGKLLYLTFSRLDIAYAVQVISQFMDKPSLEHMTAAHKVLKYLKRSPSQVVSRSSAEAEYRAMASASCEIIWLKHLPANFGIKHKDAVVLYSDSQSTMHISKNPIFHEKTKHIEMDCYFIREKVIEGHYLWPGLMCGSFLALSWSVPVGDVDGCSRTGVFVTSASDLCNSLFMFEFGWMIDLEQVLELVFELTFLQSMSHGWLLLCARFSHPFDP